MWDQERGAAEKKTEKMTFESFIFQFNSSSLLALYFYLHFTSQAFIFSQQAHLRTKMDERLESIFKETGTILTYELKSNPYFRLLKKIRKCVVLE